MRGHDVLDEGSLVRVVLQERERYEKASTLAGQLLAEQTGVPLGAEIRGTLERIVADAGL